MNTRATIHWLMIPVAAILAANSLPARADVFLKFRPTVAGGAAVSPEGCFMEPGPALGRLGGPDPENNQHTCHTGLLGYDDFSEVGAKEIAAPSSFTSEPFANGVDLSGLASVHVHYFNYGGIWGTLYYTLYDVPPSPLGVATFIARGIAIAALGTDTEPDFAGSTGVFDFGHYHLASGHSLRLDLAGHLAGLAAGRLLFGGHPLSTALDPTVAGHDFEDAGLYLATPQTDGTDPSSDIGSGLDGVTGSGSGTGSESSSTSGSDSSGGALSGALLWPLLLATARRNRQRIKCSLAAVMTLVTGTAHATMLSLPFTADLPSGAGLSPEGCWLDPGIAAGNLGPGSGETADGAYTGYECHSGTFPSDATQVNRIGYANFTSAPFADGLTLAGPASLLLHFVFISGPGGTDSIGYSLEEVRADGTTNWIFGGGADAWNGAILITFDVGPARIAPGSRLRLSMIGFLPARILYGGVPVASSVSDVPGLVADVQDYSDSGLTLVLADEIGKSGPMAGAITPALCLPLLLAALLRRSRLTRLQARHEVELSPKDPRRPPGI